MIIICPKFFVSTITTKLNIVKIILYNKIEDELLTHFFMLYLEREIATKLSRDSIVNLFLGLKNVGFNFKR
jgi:hypothetical protein